MKQRHHKFTITPQQIALRLEIGETQAGSRPPGSTGHIVQSALIEHKRLYRTWRACAYASPFEAVSEDKTKDRSANGRFLAGRSCSGSRSRRWDLHPHRCALAVSWLIILKSVFSVNSQMAYCGYNTCSAIASFTASTTSFLNGRISGAAERANIENVTLRLNHCPIFPTGVL